MSKHPSTIRSLQSLRDRILADNKTVEQAKRLKLSLRVIRTDGTFILAVPRDDLDLATDARAQARAIERLEGPHE